MPKRVSLDSVQAAPTVVRGSIPVILSVPHAVAHIRPGFPERFPKSGETGTDLLAHRLRTATGAWTVMASVPLQSDPNWYRASSYKEMLSDIIERNGIRLVVDLHGAPGTRPTVVDYDYLDDSNGINRTQELLFLDSFRRQGFTENEIRLYDAHVRHPSTIASYSTHAHGIPAYQVEVNVALRRGTHPRHDALLDALSGFVLQSIS